MPRWFVYLVALLALAALWIWPLLSAPEPVVLPPAPGTPATRPAAASPTAAGPARGSRPTATPEQPLAPETMPFPTVESSSAGTLIYTNAAQAMNGAGVDIQGQGFEPGEEVVVTLDGRDVIGSRLADKEGRVAAVRFVVPADLPPGTYTIGASGADSGRGASTKLHVQGPLPWIKLTTEVAKPLSRIVASGGNFQPGETVAVHLDSLGGEPLATLQADEYGNLPASGIRVPFSAPGDHILLVVGAESRYPARAPLYVLEFAPWIVLTNYTPQAEQPAGLVANDFAPGEAIRVYVDEVAGDPLAVLRADDRGQASNDAAFRLDASFVGHHTLIAVGEQTQKSVPAEFDLLPFTPVLELTRYAGPSGTDVAFTGSQFAVEETVKAYVGTPGEGTEVATFQTDARGSFSVAGQFTLPPGTKAGELPLTVVGERSRAPATVAFTVLPLNPGIELSQRNGPAGAAITLVGWGFAPGEPIGVYLGAPEGAPATTIQADANGNFERAGPITIPSDAKGKVPIVLRGERSHGRAELAYTVGSTDEPGRPAPDEAAPTPRPDEAPLLEPNR